MDPQKALALEARLVGQRVGAWTIERLINNGKSAAVFEGTCGSDRAAVKIFDDELIERYGDHTQIARIERELTLVGKQHPNLVRIIEGGVDPISNNHFIIMGLVDGQNVKQCLAEIPPLNIPSLIRQLASAAKFLEDLDLVHRDIKPENIVLTDNFSKLTLLDLGVLRPIGKPGLTDDKGVQAFVGTLQYSSPEFLLRNEEDSVYGWRALTFYQLGGVLHDLLTRRCLFEEASTPYGRLVLAVRDQIPDFAGLGSSPLIRLAQSCLVKDWKKRLELVSWSDFEVLESSKSQLTTMGMRAEIRKTQAMTGALQARVAKPKCPSGDILNHLSHV